MRCVMRSALVGGLLLCAACAAPEPRDSATHPRILQGVWIADPDIYRRIYAFSDSLDLRADSTATIYGFSRMDVRWRIRELKDGRKQLCLTGESYGDAHCEHTVIANDSTMEWSAPSSTPLLESERRHGWRRRHVPPRATDLASDTALARDLQLAPPLR